MIKKLFEKLEDLYYKDETPRERELRLRIKKQRKEEKELEKIKKYMKHNGLGM